jgi:hypothetical protein
MTNPSTPYLLISDNTSNNDTANNDNDDNELDNSNASKDDNNKENKNVPPNMVKTATTMKTKAAASTPKKAHAKTTGEEVIDIDTPPKKKQCAANQAAAYFSTKTLKGYTVNYYSKGSKNCIGVVFHEAGITSERALPVMSLDQGGKALKVEWKLSKHLFTDKQATAQAIPKDSAWYNGYVDTLDHIHQAGVFPINKYYRGAPQVIALDRECVGDQVTNCWCVLTNKVVDYKGRDHIQFNLMYVMTLKVAKDCHTLTLGPKFAGIAKFGDVRVASLKHDGGGGGGGRGKGGSSRLPLVMTRRSSMLRPYILQISH